MPAAGTEVGGEATADEPDALVGNATELDVGVGLGEGVLLTATADESPTTEHTEAITAVQRAMEAARTRFRVLREDMEILARVVEHTGRNATRRAGCRVKANSHVIEVASVKSVTNVTQNSAMILNKVAQCLSTSGINRL